MKKRRVSLIITGFDPFGGDKSNPSGELVQMFPDLITVKGLGNCSVKRLVLPTCCEASWKALKKELKKTGKEDVVLIMTGLAQGTRSIALERVALNLREYRIPDNQGHKHQAQKIVARADNAFFTKVPVVKVRNSLIKRGIPCDVSNYAGTFVCNDIYFRALNYQRSVDNLKAVVFIHVPLPKDFMATVLRQETKPDLASLKKGKRSKRDSIAFLQESVQVAVVECAKRIDEECVLS